MSAVPHGSPPSLEELLARYLQREPESVANGMTGEVVPHDAGAAPLIQAGLAWRGSFEALKTFVPITSSDLMAAPSDWAALIQTPDPVFCIPFAAGNVPQLIRSVQPLWETSRLVELSTKVQRQASWPSLVDWANKVARKASLPQILLASGVLRLARCFDAASALLMDIEQSMSPEWEPAWLNERAALEWAKGDREAAQESWQRQLESIPVLFNRGIAALFCDQLAVARKWLTKAASQLNEENSWHHLARLYLTVAEIRS